MENGRIAQLLQSDSPVTALAISSEDEVLLAGDAGGHLHVFKAQPQLRHWVSFVSHLSLFDRDSAGTESEQVTAAHFVASYPRTFTCLSASEKTIKLWSVRQQNGKSRLRLTYPPVNDFRIHSLTVHTAKDQFVACDDLSLTLWHFDHPSSAYNLGNFRPSRIEDLREVLLFAAFHPEQSSLLTYTSTTGAIRIADLRLRAQAFPPALVLKNKNQCLSGELTTSVSGIAFSPQEPVLFAREIQSVVTWDLRSPASPVTSCPILNNKLQLLTRGDTPKFHIATVEGGWVTGGMDGNLILMKSGQREEVDLSLGRAFVPFVVSNPQSLGVVAGAKGRVLELRADIGFSPGRD